MCINKGCYCYPNTVLACICITIHRAKYPNYGLRVSAFPGVSIDQCHVTAGFGVSVDKPYNNRLLLQPNAVAR